ncbi:hypothetical protein JCM6882_004848 [Rhodosporidiobolus microsporus]
MRAPSFALLALSSLALFAAANPSPEPCSDHPGVVHAPGEFGDPVVKNVAKVVKIKVPGSSSSGKSKSKAKAKTSSSSSKKVSTSTKSSASAKSSSSSSGWKPPAKTVKKKVTPKVQHSDAKTVASGASKAISSFTNSSRVPDSVAKDLDKAISSAIDKQLGSVTTVTHTATSTVLSTETANATVTQTIANSTILVPQPTTLVRTLTQNVTQIQTSTLITTSDAIAASLNIQQALDDAFAAANLSQSSLDEATRESLMACLETVLEAGGMPDGYSCLTSTGKDSAGLTSTLNTILEQFVGILPNKILESVFDAVTPLLSTLLPSSEAALVAQIQSSISSVIASLSGNSVTALEQVSQCYTEAVQQSANVSTLACFTKEGGAYSTLQTATNGVLEQFIGVLPASLTTAVENILSYNLGNATTPDEKLAASVSAQISNAINSVASSLSGNTVTLAEVLQNCAAELISTGNSTAAALCVTQTSAPELSMTTINSINQQFAGYLPSSFFTDLVDYSTAVLAGNASASINATASANPHNLTQAELNAAFETFFNNATSYGAAYVTCLNEVQSCVTNAIVKSGTIDAVCPGPVDGCVGAAKKAKADDKRFRRHVRSKRTTAASFGFAGKIRAVQFWKEAP